MVTRLDSYGNAMMMRCAILLLAVTLGLACTNTGKAAENAGRVLWFDGNVPDPSHTTAHRQRMVDYLNEYNGGQTFNVSFVSTRKRGGLAEALNGQDYDLVVLDLLANRNRFNDSDLTALQTHYTARRGLMLDGSFWIRSIRHNPTTEFPGTNGATGRLLVNQIKAMLDAGGGTLIGTDHSNFQVGANTALKALLPDARFTGSTSPSTDGTFKGKVLLAHAEPVRALDILEHWQTVPNQGEAPVGSFVDFTGQPVTLFDLVSTADKPGGGRKRPYVSASFDPGDDEFAIDGDVAPQVEETEPEPELPDNMPTRKSAP
ncbi:MAG: hypothetical protein AAF566_05720 [Pseudomonadota bacterium]